jgi:hypothetical protein
MFHVETQFKPLRHQHGTQAKIARFMQEFRRKTGLGSKNIFHETQ